MKILSVVFAVIGILFIVGLVAFAFQGTDFFMYKFWAPKYAGVQRDVFENTPSYVRGNIQELNNRIMEYDRCKAQGKDKEAAMLGTNILQYASGLNQEQFPQDIKDSLSKIRAENAKF